MGPPVDFIRIMQDLFPERDLSRYDPTLIAMRQSDWKIEWGSDSRHDFYHVAEDPIKSATWPPAIPTGYRK